MTAAAFAGELGGWARIDDLVDKIQAQLRRIAQRVSVACNQAISLSWDIAQWYVDLRRSDSDVAAAIDSLLDMTKQVGGVPGKVLQLLRSLHDALVARAA